jgi:hypothetical protein
MTDVTTLSDDDLLAQLKAQQQTQSRTAMSHTVSSFDPANNAWMDQYGPLSGASWPERLAAGAGRGMVHTGASLGNLVGLVPNSAMAEEKKLDAPLLADTAGSVGNMVGESAITAPLGMGAANALGTAGKLGLALSRNPISNAAIQGGVQGLSTSDPGERGTNTIMGGVTGATLGANQALVSKLVNGLKRTPDAQYLIDKRVSLTPGLMNPGGMFNTAEQLEARMHIPGVESARDAAEHQYQALIIGKGAAPGAKITPSGNISDMLQQAYDSYAPLYDQAKGYPVSPTILRADGPDVPLNTTFAAASRAPGVPKSLQQSENAWLQDRLTQLPLKPDSADLLQLRSDIRQRGRTANLKTDTDSGHVANIADRAERGVTAALNSQLPPEPLQALATADSNYGNYKIIESAVAKSKDNLAGLTPQKLSQAVFDSVPDSAYARGAGGPLRELAKAGTNVFQTTVPLNGASLAAGVPLAIMAHAHPAVGATLGAGQLGLTMTPGGRALASGTTAPQVTAQKLIAALRNNTPDYARNVGGQLALRGATAAGMPVTQAALPNALAAALLLGPPAAQSH